MARYKNRQVTIVQWLSNPQDDLVLIEHQELEGTERVNAGELTFSQEELDAHYDRNLKVLDDNYDSHVKKEADRKKFDTTQPEMTNKEKYIVQVQKNRQQEQLQQQKVIDQHKTDKPVVVKQPVGLQPVNPQSPVNLQNKADLPKADKPAEKSASVPFNTVNKK